MWPFKKKKKKVFRVIWSYSSGSSDRYTEIVKAYDIIDAWNCVKKQHPTSIYCISIKSFPTI